MSAMQLEMINDIHAAAASEAHWQEKVVEEAAREAAADRDELEFHLSVLEVVGDLLLGVFSVASFTLLMAVL